MRYSISTDKGQINDAPLSSEVPEKKSRRTHVIIGVVVCLVVALVLVAILVGVYMFTKAQEDIVQMSLQLKNGMTQEVTSNPNTNIVQFHVQEKNQETWTVIDYNADLKVMKIQTATETKCYVTPLNESSPVDVLKMKTAGVQDDLDLMSVVYSTNGQQIKDTSFLSKTAQDTCSGVSTYWLYPSCTGVSDGPKLNNTQLSNGLQKRDNILCPIYAPFIYNCYSSFFFCSDCVYKYVCYYALPFPFVQFIYSADVCIIFIPN